MSSFEHSATADADAGVGIGRALRHLQHGGHVLDGVVGLEVGGLVGDGAVAPAVGLVEGVAGERFDEREDRLGIRLAVALGDGAGDEALALGEHDLGLLLAHRLAHDVGLAERVAAETAGR